MQPAPPPTPTSSNGLQIEPTQIIAEMISGPAPAPSVALGKSFVFPSRQNPVFHITLESLVTRTRHPFRVFENLPPDKRWLELVIVVRKEGSQERVSFEPLRDLKLFDASGKKMLLLPNVDAADDLGRGQRPRMRMLSSTLFMRAGQEGYLRVGTLARLEQLPLKLHLPDGTVLTLETSR